MCVLEVLIIGGGIYYYKKHHKVNKARKAALAAGQPFQEKNGCVTYPPLYPGLPPYPDAAINVTQPAPAPKEHYSDAPVTMPSEKTGLMVETREMITRDEKF